MTGIPSPGFARELLLEVFPFTPLPPPHETTNDQTTSRQVAQRDLYAVLELQSDATDADVKAAYRALARRWHPDKNPDDTQVLFAYFSFSDFLGLADIFMINVVYFLQFACCPYLSISIYLSISVVSFVSGSGSGPLRRPGDTGNRVSSIEYRLNLGRGRNITTINITIKGKRHNRVYPGQNATQQGTDLFTA